MASLSTGRLSEIVLRLFAWGEYRNFVETGTYLGDSAKWASSHFERVITIELSEYYTTEARRRLSLLPNVQILCGNSGHVLREVVPVLEGPSIYWLDGHYSFGITAGENRECPVLEELACLQSLEGHDIILIDDAHMFLAPAPPPHKAEQWPTFGEILYALRSINPSFHIEIMENAIVAVPAVLKKYLIDFCREPQATAHAETEVEKTHDEFFVEKKLWMPPAPLRLHLGCGETQLDGYVNIDYRQEHHNVMRSQADFSADLTHLSFKNEVVDEIRLHHVFEHFNRVTALAMLIRWHSWLKVGGKLHIETPDIIGSAQTLLSAVSLQTKMRVVRHLAGDQAADWGYHVDHWFPKRFEHTLRSLGFTDIKARSWKWEREPYLANVEVTALKAENRTLDFQLRIADDLLWESTVDDVEKPTYEVWCKQLRDFLGGQHEPWVLSSTGSKELREDAEFVQASPVKGIKVTGPGIESVLREFASELPIEEIHGFNQKERDLWVSQKAKSVSAGSMVLDVGAGTCHYRSNFSHCEYKTHDFKKYKGYQDDSEGLYGKIDYISEINSIPVASESFDVILCTEVLEHVPEPIVVLQELSRILKPGGRLFITAPLGSGLHQLPYHYYGGYTPFWYRHFCCESNLKVVEIVPNGGFFKHLAQECARVAWTMPKCEKFYGEHKEIIGELFGELLPRFLFNFDEKCFIEQFTVGYHIEAVKSGPS
jgi:predicted SAM-dependent methyltransferase